MRVMLLLVAFKVTASAQTATRSFYNERGQLSGSASTHGATKV
jgi:hypothetical protein